MKCGLYLKSHEIETIPQNLQIVQAATNNCFGYLSIIFSINRLVVWSIKSENGDNYILKCQQPKDIPFTERKQKKVTFKKQESENFDFISKNKKNTM